MNSQIDFASMLIPDHINNIFIGDFNLHVSDPNDTDSAIFNDTIEAMGLLQHVGKSTHKLGNMLDLIISEIQGDTTIRNNHYWTLSIRSLCGCCYA